MSFSETMVEDTALAWLEALGYPVLDSQDIAAGEAAAERSDANYRHAALEGVFGPPSPNLRIDRELPLHMVDDLLKLSAPLRLQRVTLSLTP